MSEEFNNLFRQKMAEKAQHPDTFTDESGQVYEGVRAQLMEEEKYYNELRTRTTERDFHSMNHLSDSLVPGLAEGLCAGKKRRSMLRRRTLSNLKDGKKMMAESVKTGTAQEKAEMSRYATTQTAPLLKSIRDYRKNIDKQKARVADDLEKLSMLDIPDTIFDVSISSRHSHFDVKNALRIKEGLDRIKKLIDENPDEFTALSAATHSRLVALLDRKEPFETTLKTVLAANGLNEDGTPVTKDDAILARIRYDAAKESFKAVVRSFGTDVAREEDTEKMRRVEALTKRGKYEKELRGIRDNLLEKWDEKAREFNDESPIEIPDGFLGEVGKDYMVRVSNQMVSGNEKESYFRLKREMLFFKLQNEPFDQKLFDEAKQLTQAQFDEMKATVPALVDTLVKATDEELIARQEEIYKAELSFMHLSDMIRRTKDAQKTSLLDKLIVKKEDEIEIRTNIEILSAFRKKVANLVASRVEDGPGLDVTKDEIDADNFINVRTDGAEHVDKALLAAQAKAKIKVQNDMVRGVVGFRTAVMAN